MPSHQKSRDEKTKISRTLVEMLFAASRNRTVSYQPAHVGYRIEPYYTFMVYVCFSVLSPSPHPVGPIQSSTTFQYKYHLMAV